MKKGERIDNLTIADISAEGKSVARVDGRVVFVEGAVPGDVVNVTVIRSRSNYLEATVNNFVTYSPHRISPVCQHFGSCGGCSWQHLSYESQLAFKHNHVVNTLKRIGGLEFPEARPIIGSEQTEFYRNKLDFTFSSQRWLTREEINSGAPFGEPALGFHVPRFFDKVLDIQRCHLQADPSNAIRNGLSAFAIREQIPFFNLRTQEGYLRTLTIRTATTGQVMVLLQVARDEPEWLDKVLDYLEQEFPAITSLQYIINTKRNDTYQDQDVHIRKGTLYIIESMTAPDGKTLQFRIGPKSFYQTNSRQAEKLYEVAFNMAGLTGKELVYDLYTGTGTIANYMASAAQKVIGLEYVEDAVADARENAKVNGIANTEFFAGDIKELLNESFLTEHGRPDVVITDPPRPGMHADVCAMLLQAEPPRIVYVSCNPATQARDLSLLSAKYRITAVQPVDMFPHTVHVENVVALERI